MSKYWEAHDGDELDLRKKNVLVIYCIQLCSNKFAWDPQCYCVQYCRKSRVHSSLPVLAVSPTGALPKTITLTMYQIEALFPIEQVVPTKE